MFFTDGRYTEQSRREVPDLERVTYSQNFAEVLREACAARGVRRLGFEDGAMTVRTLRTIEEALDGVELAAVGDEVDRLRWVKDEEELALIQAAQDATDQAFEDILEKLAVGQSERQVAQELEHAMRRAGADGLSFDTIVAFGENSAEPHHEPNHRSLEEGDIVKMDFGALWAATTPTSRGPSRSARSPPSSSRSTRSSARRRRRASTPCAPGPRRRRGRGRTRVIEDAGYGGRFSHGLGHGVGLEIHEGPGLRRAGTTSCRSAPS